jgi:hypothetical protein
MSVTNLFAQVPGRVGRAAETAERTMAWLSRHPLLPVQMLVLMLIAWGRLGVSVGLDDLLWHHVSTIQFLNGLACGWLFGQLLLVRYLLDRKRSKFRFPWTLFPKTSTGTQQFGQFLAMTWPALLLALVAGKLLSPRFWHEPLMHLPFPAGLLLSVLAAMAVAQLWSHPSMAGVLNGLKLLAKLPGLRDDVTTPEEKSLHALASACMVLFTLLSIIVYGLFLLGLVLPPMVVLCFFLALINGIYGFLAFHIRGMQHVAIILLVILGISANSTVLDSQHEYKRSFPGLETYGPGKEIVALESYYQLLRRQESGQAPRPDLIKSEEPLRAMRQRWQALHPEEPNAKPKIVLIATSGGGIRASVWTAAVLEGLEQELPQLRQHVRLLTGASGGMVAAGMYVADFEYHLTDRRLIDPATGLGKTFGALLARDSLSSTVQTMLLWDAPRTFIPGPTCWDRGRALEWSWQQDMPPIGRSFEELKALERQGKRPSIIFSPMLVEDARRLLISNLDLLELTWNHGDVLAMKSLRQNNQLAGAPDRPTLSVSAVEFFRLFPQAKDFKVATAARMSATFPLINPAVSLPTVPVRRVVDAGYYDNYGVNVAATWLHRHREAILEHTSGVVIIEIRAFRNGYARWNFHDRAAERRRLDPDATPEEKANANKYPPAERELFAQSLEGLSTPMEAVLTARERSMQYRNDEMLHLLSREFNTTDRPSFFTTVAFECDVDANLSWTLPPWEARAIAEAFQGKRLDDPAAPLPRHIGKRVKALKEWFGTGGK